MWVKNITDFWRFCYLNVPCLRMNITLIVMSSSSEEFTYKYENSKTDVSVAFLYIELNIKKEECVAAKGAKLSSWLLPQSSYKWVEVIRY